MYRDQFYQQIQEHLGGKLDPDIFEACAVDLLREIYPGLVPIRGGKDSGMDGAIPDGEGEPYPLIVTTQADVIGNLTKNIRSFLEHGGKRNIAVLATSQALSPRRIQNLYKRAAELDFTLIQVHPREDIAQRLYYRPEWCRELLNISGRPPAFSIFPKSSRPLVNSSLIGRETDLQWLFDTRGDRLLVGDPGSGKTYLLHQFAVKGGGLFVVDEDRGEIVAGIRSQQPASIIVDDSHVRLSVLDDLQQIRKELGVEYSILASCWRSYKDQLSLYLNLPEEKIYDLRLLTRDQIVEVINNAGIIGPLGLVREIVNQAEGRPGLAATLTHMCMIGSVQEVFLGDVLSKSVRTFFEPRLGSQAIDVLAAFSVGGNVGLSIEDVAGGYGLKSIQVKQIASDLATGGIVWDTYENSLSVHPPALRCALVRDVFFQGALSLPIEPFIERSFSLEQTAKTLVGAYSRKANIPTESLISILEQANSVSTWIDYAWQGEEETGWILENHPELTHAIAQPALHHKATIVIPRLFQLSISDDRPLPNATDHPLRMISDWVRSAKPGDPEAIGRRKLLTQLACKWLEQGEDIETGCLALQISLSTTFEAVFTDPGAGNTVTIQHGALLRGDLQEIFADWPTILRALSILGQIAWRPIFDIVNEWTFPHTWDIKIPEETREVMQSSAQKMIQDLVGLAKDHQGVLQSLKQISHDARFDIFIELDPEFEILYPVMDRRDRVGYEQNHRPIVRRIAEEWSQKKPGKIAEKLNWIKGEASFVRNPWPDWPVILCNDIADFAKKSVDWAREFIDSGLEGRQILPFLEKAAKNNEPGWVDLANECLGSSTLRWITVTTVIKSENSPDDLLENVFRNLSDFSQTIETLCIRGEVPEKTVQSLLEHTDVDVACAAAYGEWYTDPRGQIRDTLKPYWKDAVIRSNNDHFVAEVIEVENDTGLAYAWLVNFIHTKHTYHQKYARVLNVVVNLLDLDDVKQILEIIPDSWDYGEFVHRLIRNDLGRYRLLLANKRLEIFHLVPLS